MKKTKQKYFHFEIIESDGLPYQVEGYAPNLLECYRMFVREFGRLERLYALSTQIGWANDNATIIIQKGVVWRTHAV